MRSLITTTIVLLCLATVSNAQTLPDYVPTWGIKCFQMFSGNANDISGNSNNGIVNFATPSTDRFGNANSAYYYFGSVANTQESFSAFTVSGGFTITAWAKSSFPVTSAPIIAGRQNNYAVTCIGFDDESVFFKLTAADDVSMNVISSMHNYTDGQWHFFCGTFDGSTMTLYVDNVQVATNTFPAFTSPMTANWQLGHDSYAPDPKTFTGDIDDLGMWEGVLTLCDRTKLFLSSNSLLSAQPANCIAHPSSSATFSVTAPALAIYQWQEDAGSGFYNISDNATYSGTTTHILTIHNPPLSYNLHKYRCLVSYGACSEFSSAGTLSVNNTAVPQVAVENDIVVAPNPAQNMLSISSPVLITNVEIFDLLGQKVFAGSPNQASAEVNISSLSSGIYLMKINDTYIKRIIKN